MNNCDPHTDPALYVFQTATHQLVDTFTVEDNIGGIAVATPLRPAAAMNAIRMILLAE